MPTIEGDTVVMASQNSRYLFNQIAKGKTSTGLFTYLNNIDSLCQATSKATNPVEFSDLDHLETALAVRSAFWVKKLTTEAA